MDAPMRAQLEEWIETVERMDRGAYEGVAMWSVMDILPAIKAALTLPAVRWTAGPPPEDMRDGRPVLVWVKEVGLDLVWPAYDAWYSERRDYDGVCERVTNADILAWADPQPPEGV